MSLQDYPLDKLEAEIQRRREQEDQNSLPTPLESPDFSKLQSTVVSAIHALADEDYCEDNDDKYWVFEAAVEAVFGHQVWEWVRAHQ